MKTSHTVILLCVLAALLALVGLSMTSVFGCCNGAPSQHNLYGCHTHGKTWHWNSLIAPCVAAKGVAKGAAIHHDAIA